MFALQCTLDSFTGTSLALKRGIHAVKTENLPNCSLNFENCTKHMFIVDCTSFQGVTYLRHCKKISL